jgi:hypothetical protein
MTDEDRTAGQAQPDGIVREISDQRRRLQGVSQPVSALLIRDRNKLEQICLSLEREFPGCEIYKEVVDGYAFWRGSNPFGDKDRINLGGVGVIKVVDAAASYLGKLRSARTRKSKRRTPHQAESAKETES